MAAGQDGAVGLVRAVERRTAQIVAALQDLDEDGLSAPSALPGWDRLTIACHLRYGARALTGMTARTLAGQPASYYPEGRAHQRPATLRPEPGERPADVVASLAQHSDVLHGLWQGVGREEWNLRVCEPPDRRDLGPLPLHRLPLLRLTEVEIHGSDLEVGLPDWSEELVQAALPFRLEWLNTRRANHRAFDDRLSGSWLLVATDGPSYRVSVDGPDVEARPADRGTGADALIEATARDLLALLLGRPVRGRVRHAGDEDFARAFTRAFPGP